MKKEQLKNRLKLLVKLLFTAGALYFVFQKIDFQEFLTTISQANFFLFLLGVLAMNVSKIISSFRLKEFYSAIGLELTTGYNIKLYYVGMFYNLFLPGSIGGDGYKVYLLRQNHPHKTRQLVSATLLDRVSGLMWLFILGGILFIFSTYGLTIRELWIYVVLLLSLILPVAYLAFRWLFPVFVSKFIITSHYSFWVQAFQVVCAYIILKSISADGNYIDYLTLFMASSVVAVIPFTVGGVGARELVFLYGYQFLDIQRPDAIAFTILFFASTALTAFSGLFFSYRIDQVQNKSSSVAAIQLTDEKQTEEHQGGHQ